MLKEQFKSGRVFILISAGALSLILIMVISLMAVICKNGFSALWPYDVVQYEMHDGSKVVGEFKKEETIPATDKKRYNLKVGNRENHADFRWVNNENIKNKINPDDVIVLERTKGGNYYGFLDDSQNNKMTWDFFKKNLDESELVKQEIKALKKEQSSVSKKSDKLNREIIYLTYHEEDLPEKISELNSRIEAYNAQFEEIDVKLNNKIKEAESNYAVFKDSADNLKNIPYIYIVRAYQPNNMGLGSKFFYYLIKVKELFFGDPREANTEGGLFPTIVGTILLIFIMSIFSFPMGVMAGIYLKEYSKDGVLVRIIRIAVNNLAGVPSIVYGMFGLAFFVYGIGGTIDEVFYPEYQTSVFKKTGLLWASLTLGLLTVPVVIVATEEALNVIPQGIREGSSALGATKFQTLYKVLLPMASPGIMTGFILAMSRAAGEVAPLMLTGVVKVTELPIDGEFPYIHLNQSFQHLGFHIFDVGFQSPNVEAALPMVFVTTLLLLGIVVFMGSGAIYLRNRMKRKFTTSTL